MGGESEERRAGEWRGGGIEGAEAKLVPDRGPQQFESERAGQPRGGQEGVRAVSSGRHHRHTSFLGRSAPPFAPPHPLTLPRDETSRA